jgi:hypothetical protein
MKTYIHYSLLFSACIIAFIFSACSNPFNERPSIQRAVNTGLVTVQIGGGSARTLLPSAIFTQYELIFTAQGKEPLTLSSAEAVQTVELEKGEWLITVRGFVVINGAEYEAASGSKTIAVTAGAELPVQISLSASKDADRDDGFFSYDIRLQLDREKFSEAVLSIAAFTGDYKKEINLRDDTAETGKDTLALRPGIYLLNIQLKNAYQTVGRTEVVHIYSNLETRADYIFKNSDFTEILPIGGSAVVHTNSGVAQEKVSVYLYSDADYEDLITVAEVNVTDNTWRTAIPASYRKVYIKMGVQDTTGYSFGITERVWDIPENGKSNIAIAISIPEPAISAYKLEASETGLSGDLDGLITPVAAGQYRITLATTTFNWIENLDRFKAIFEAEGDVTVGNVVQQSGVTPNNFWRDVVYTVTALDNAKKTYTVALESAQTTGLPAIKIDTQNRPVNSTSVWVEGTAYTLYDANGVQLLNDYTDIKGRGNSTWGMPKKPYSLKLSTKKSVLGMSEHKRWALMANYSDKTLLRTEVAFRMGTVFDNLAWTSRSKQVNFYFNNQYVGVYQLTESIKIDTNRVNINEISEKNPGGGYILEIDVRKGEIFNFTTTRGIVFNCSDPDDGLDKVIDGDTRTIFEKIRTDVQHVEDVIYSADFADFDEGYRKYIDIDSFVDWYLVNEITKNNDAVFYSSVYMYYDPVQKKYCMGPLWDYDISSGNINYNGNDNPEGFWIKGCAWITRLFQDPYFVSLVKNRWNAKKQEIANLSQYIDDQAAYLDRAQTYNFKKWNILNIYVWPNAVVTGSYQGEIDYIKSWLGQRIAWLDTAINGL